ncbi:uncharacterized protein LOC6535514 isoform X1 [Drosophila yakuba]|uniref:Uncharacterized protein, isoform B n=1 Tax=Drosophila yakuba TaxID=7245 RepID=A0A0R1E0D9_DROYA|nr:uncharacterized protein LOC6535514 isoform X1 [Drosophila yakuba]KRK02768.1 uncharacterized protein Dyak_GE25233, isoform B [Drosophila yakuba]
MVFVVANIEAKYCKDEGKKPEMFELKNNATIGELKQKLEVKVGLPLARLNVKSFHKSLENEEYITNLLRVQDKNDSTSPATTLNGTAFSLYHEKSFVGFLQFYTIPEGKSQQDFLNLPKSSMLLPVDRLPHFCEASDSQDSSASSASNKTNTSFESASTSASSEARKRRVSASDEESAAKRIRSNLMNVVKVIPQQNLLSDKPPGSMDSIFGSKIQVMACKSEPSTSSSAVEQLAECKNRKTDCCMPKNCRKRDTRPPYANTMPENRRYGLVITNQNPDADGVDTLALMDHFHSLFEESGASVSELNFSECASTQTFDSSMLVVCEDEETAQWVMSAVDGMCPPHSCQPLIEFFGLLRTTFVLPLVSPSKSLCVIFALLESQNPGLDTNKWAVVKRSTLDCNDVERQVAQFCDNVVIEVYIDEESKEFITERCSKLRYCFWQLRFSFDC